MYQDCSYTNAQGLECTNSVMVISCKKQITVKVSTGFLSTKLLINGKISLANFIYDFIVTFCTPSDKTKKMTDTDSASFMFIIIADQNCNVGERATREITLKILLENDIYDRLDKSTNTLNSLTEKSTRTETS